MQAVSRGTPVFNFLLKSVRLPGLLTFPPKNLRYGQPFASQGMAWAIIGPLTLSLTLSLSLSLL